MKLFKNKKGSQLVEKILMTAFAVAGGAAVITYGANVINASKTTNISLDGGVVATNSSGVQLIAGHKYKISDTTAFHNLATRTSKNDCEYFSVSDYQWDDGRRMHMFENDENMSFSGFVGYSCWCYDNNQEKFYLEEPEECCVELCYVFDEAMNSRSSYRWFSEKSINDSYPRLNDDATCGDLVNKYFVFSGVYVRRGNGPCLLDYLVEVE